MIRKIEVVAGVLAAADLFTLMAITFIDVCGRNFFESPLPGASELTEVLLALMVFLLLPTCAFREEHISVDLIDMFRGKALIFVEKLLVAILGGGLFGLIGWRLWILAERASGYRDATPTLGIRLDLVLYAMSVLAFVTAIAFVGVLANWRHRSGNAELERMLRAEGIELPAEAGPRPAPRGAKIAELVEN